MKLARLFSPVIILLLRNNRALRLGSIKRILQEQFSIQAENKDILSVLQLLIEMQLVIKIRNGSFQKIDAHKLERAIPELEGLFSHSAGGVGCGPWNTIPCGKIINKQLDRLFISIDVYNERRVVQVLSKVIEELILNTGKHLVVISVEIPEQVWNSIWNKVEALFSTLQNQQKFSLLILQNQ